MQKTKKIIICIIMLATVCASFLVPTFASSNDYVSLDLRGITTTMDKTQITSGRVGKVAYGKEFIAQGTITGNSGAFYTLGGTFSTQLNYTMKYALVTGYVELSSFEYISFQLGDQSTILSNGEFKLKLDKVTINSYNGFKFSVTLDTPLDGSTQEVFVVRQILLFDTKQDRDDYFNSTSYDVGYNDGYNSGNFDGYNNGYDDGYDDGYEVGTEDGYDIGYSEGMTEGVDAGYEVGYMMGEADGYENGYNDGHNDGYNDGYSDGYDNGYDFDAYNYGYESGHDIGIGVGYTNGYNDAMEFVGNEGQGFKNLFDGVASVPVTILSSLLGFEIFGINVLGFVASIVSLILVFFVIKRFI